MVIEWMSILFVILVILGALVVLKLIEKKVDMNAEIKRKLFHMTMGLTMLTFPHIFNSVFSVGVLGIIALGMMYLLKHTKLKESLGTILYSVDRDSLGEVFFAISVFLIFYLSKGDKVLFSIPILILTFADSTAALIGKNYGKNNLAEYSEDAKSSEGSFMFFIVAFMATLVPLLLFTEVGREETLIISTIVGFNVAMIEMISHTGNDNLLIPLTTYAFLVTHISLDVQTLRMNLLILGILFILVRIVKQIKAWSKLALVEILVTGYLMITLYGWYAVIPPLLELLTVMIFPKRRESEKNNIYDARIIETNLIIGIAICGIVAITGLRKEFFMLYATCFAMHLAVNTFVRMKYFINLSEIDSAIIGIGKGFGFIFVPSLLLQQIIFHEIVSVPMLFAMFSAIVIITILILWKKKNVTEEKVSLDSGYMQTKMVFVLTLIIGVCQYLQTL